MVYGEVYAPCRPDSDDEFMTAEEIKKAAHEFMRKGITDMVDTNHDNAAVEGVFVVESFIARKGDPDFLEGAWVVGVHVNHDETWEKIKKGELNGFSMEAMVQRETQEVDLELPPVVSGMTSKSDATELPGGTVQEAHAHEFYVSYGPNGEFLGGITNTVDGHRHIIKGGTVTETTSGHNHRFSSVDNVTVHQGV